MCDPQAVADSADVIINGYAFTLEGDLVRVLNLYRLDRAAVFSLQGEMLETSMDDIELEIVRDYFERSLKYLEVDVA